MTGLHRNPENPGAYSYALVAVVLPPITWLFLLLRLYVRGFMTKNLGADDWVALAATISFAGFCGLSIAINQLIPSEGSPTIDDIVKITNVCPEPRSLHGDTLTLYSYL
jgi:hypothetical protein